MGATSVGTALPRQVTRDAEAIAHGPSEELWPGVRSTLLWRDDGGSAGYLRLGSGAAIPEHTHERAEHHVWLLEGAATLDGRRLEPWAYWFVPPGAPHEVRAGDGGCALFYLHLRR